MRVILVEPGAAPEVRDIEWHGNADELLGGFAGLMQFPFDAAGVLHDADGALKGKPQNRMYRGQWLHGRAVIVGVKDGTYCDLSPEQEVLYAQRWKNTKIPYEKMRWDRC